MRLQLRGCDALHSISIARFAGTGCAVAGRSGSSGETDSEGDLPLVVTGWISLCRGDREGAMDAYRQLVSQYRKATRKRKLHLPPLSAMMTVMTLLKQDEPVHATTVIELTRYAVDKGFGIKWSLLQGLLRECNGTSTLSPTRNTGLPFAGMAALCKHWCCSGVVIRRT